MVQGYSFKEGKKVEMVEIISKERTKNGSVLIKGKSAKGDIICTIQKATAANASLPKLKSKSKKSKKSKVSKKVSKKASKKSMKSKSKSKSKSKKSKKSRKSRK